MVSLSCEAGSVNVYNVHLVPQWTIAEFRGALTSVSQRLRENEGGLGVVGGDFNFVCEGEGRLDLVEGSAVGGDRLHEQVFLEVLPGLAELAQSSPTRREVREGVVVSASRIDRYYTSAPTIDILDMDCKVAARGNVMKNARASDHIPVMLSISMPGLEPRRSSSIPKWVARHGLFEEVLGELLAQCDAEDIYDRLAEFKCVAGLAKVLFPRRLALWKARSSEEKLHWAAVLHRAARSGDRLGVRRACTAHDELRQFVNSEGGVEAPRELAAHIAALHSSILEEEVKEEGLGGQEDDADGEGLEGEGGAGEAEEMGP